MLPTNAEERKTANRIPNRRWGIAALLGVGVLVNYFDRVNLSVAKDALHAEFGISTLTFGYILSAFNWTYAALQLPMGVLLDRFGVTKLGRIGALLWSVASFGTAAASSIPAFIGTRFLLGIGEAPTFPAYAKAVGHWFPRQERSFATAIFDAAAKFGPAVGVLFVGGLILRFGWRLSFAATGLVSLLYFAVFYVFYRDPAHDKKLSAIERQYIIGDDLDSDGAVEDRRSAPLSYLLKQRKVIGLCVGFFSYNYCFYLLLYWMPSYFSSLKVSPLQSLIYTSVPWLVATVTDLFIGGLLVDHLIQRGYRDTVVRQTVLISGTVLGLALAGAMSTTRPEIAVVWISIALGGLSAAAPVGWSIPSLIAPRNSVGKVGGILNFANQVAGITSPLVTGYLARNTNSFSGGIAITALLLLAGIASYIFLLGKIQRVPEPSESAAF